MVSIQVGASSCLGTMLCLGEHHFIDVGHQDVKLDTKVALQYRQIIQASVATSQQSQHPCNDHRGISGSRSRDDFNFLG